MWLTIGNLRGVIPAGDTLFLLQGTSQPQSFNWEKYGLSLSAPEGILLPSDTCEVAVTALAGGEFEFPKGSELVSAVYAISISNTLLKPLTANIQHCVALETPEQCNYLKFVRAPLNNGTPPYQFKPFPGGVFKPGSQYGSISCAKFCLIAEVLMWESGEGQEGGQGQNGEGQGGNEEEQGGNGDGQGGGQEENGEGEGENGEGQGGNGEGQGGNGDGQEGGQGENGEGQNGGAGQGENGERENGEGGQGENGEGQNGGVGQVENEEGQNVERGQGENGVGGYAENGAGEEQVVCERQEVKGGNAGDGERHEERGIKNFCLNLTFMDNFSCFKNIKCTC